MADGVGSFTGAFAGARDAVQAIGTRLAALGPGVDAQLAALAVRLGTLPAAARFAPFGELGAALAGGSAQASDRAAKKRNGGPRVASAKPASAGKAKAESARPGSRPADFAPELGAALAGGRAAAGGASRPDLAGPLLAEPVLEAMAALARLTRQAPAGPASGTDSLLAAPAAIAQHVAQWMAGQLESAATPSLGFDGVPVGGGDGANGLPSQELMARILAGLDNPARRGAATPSAKPKPDRARAGTSPFPPENEAVARAADAGPAPRAPSKLLTPAPSTPASDTAATDRPDAPPNGPTLDEDAVDAMTRALVDQAWLRGVDLR